MKNLKKLSLAAFIFILLLIQTRSIGSFSFTEAVYNFNKSVFNKFEVKHVFLVFCILPAYEIAIISDIVRVNVVEFWTGNNLRTMHPSQVETQKLVSK
jgi:ABC-type dipeptide/oligopeptide/nickel transport system permease component